MRALSPRVLREMRELVSCCRNMSLAPVGWDYRRLQEALDAALKPKRAPQAARKEKRAKRGATHDEWASIRESVFTRACGRCENCGRVVGTTGLHPDHMFGGADRRPMQSFYSVWAICPTCHEFRTLNKPSAVFWLEKFAAFLRVQGGAAMEWGDETDRRGYEAAFDEVQARLTKARVKAALSALPHGRATP